MSSSSFIDLSSSYNLIVESVSTTPYDGQKPGTSGLRKKVTEFEKPHYLENFVQSIFDLLPLSSEPIELVVSGDGRYGNIAAIDTITRMAFANGVKRIVIGLGGLMTTPCCSHIIRKLKLSGGIILTASHNPGGPKEDFGIKYNIQNGGPAPESFTDNIFKGTKNIKSYKIIKESKLNINLDKVASYKIGSMQVDIIDAPSHYTEFMKSIFDFDSIKKLLHRKNFSFVYDAMNGVAGPFARDIFINQLGLSSKSLIHGQPKTDFGGLHPDPNLTYAETLVNIMGLGGGASNSHSHSHHGVDHEADEWKGIIPDFGAAADGDADRNMILGKQFFVTPSDSLAIIAAYAQRVIPYFKSGLKGVARSMPTSAAVDIVAKKLGLECHVVPTGWKFFGNLMDAGRLSLCGEESFGTGSDHIREKDGVWAVLAWLSILEYVNRGKTDGETLVSVKDIVIEHWNNFGRNYYSRYDYENVDSAAANNVMNHLLQFITNVQPEKTPLDSYIVSSADEFTYHDPVDHSISAHQGIRIHFSDGSRIIYRLSGTGSVGATIRIYIEKYENDNKKIEQQTADALEPLVKIALSVSKIKEFTGREGPTVIT